MKTTVDAVSSNLQGAVPKMKGVADLVATSTAVAAVLQWVPAVAALVAAIYTIYRIYDLWDIRRKERETGRSRIERMRKD